MSNHHTALNRRRWSRTRRQAFTRDGYRCQRCGKAGKLEGHHIKRLRDGGDLYDPANVETLCRDCHIREHRPDDMTPGRAEWLDFLETLG